MIQKNLLTTNSKLRKDRIKTFSLPPIKSCPFAGECKLYCYARKGRYNLPSVGRALNERLKLTRNLPRFFIRMDSEISRLKSTKYIRIHSAGDFYSPEYMRVWFALARNHPTKVFYAYTKSIGWAKKSAELGYIPPNFRMIYSYGSREDYLINPKKDFHASIFRDAIPPDYTNGSDSDLVAAIGESKKIGLLIH